MSVHRSFLLQCLACACLGAAMLAQLAGGQDAFQVPDLLAGGRVGKLRIGMAQEEVEALLQHRLPADMQDQGQFALAMLSAPGELRALGVGRIAGIDTWGLDLTFTAPVGNDRRLISVRIGISCDDLPELARRLGGWETADPAPVYAWGLVRKPNCQLSLWKPLGQDN